MEPKFYQYNRYYCFAWLFNCCLWLYLVTKPFVHQQSPFWTYLRITAVILWGYRFCTVIYYYLIPLLKRKTALKFDSEKLYYGIKNKVINWNEIKEIRLSSFGNSVKIILRNGKKLSINIGAIKGNDDEIYKSILAHLHSINPKGDSKQ